MKVTKATTYQIVLTAQDEEVTGHNFVFDIDLLVPHRSARFLRIERKTMWQIDRWEMPWKKFLRQTTVGGIVMIDRDHFRYSTIPK